MKSGQCEKGSKLAPMGCAAAQGRTECLQALLDAGGPVDTEDGYGMTPLQVCHLFAKKHLAIEHRIDHQSVPLELWDIILIIQITELDFKPDLLHHLAVMHCSCKPVAMCAGEPQIRADGHRSAAAKGWGQGPRGSTQL